MKKYTMCPKTWENDEVNQPANCNVKYRIESSSQTYGIYETKTLKFALFTTKFGNLTTKISESHITYALKVHVTLH